MSESIEKLVDVVRDKVGAKFKQHDVPNLCDNGRVSWKSCMDKGLGVGGYDCSGLVVASVCEVFELGTDSWDMQLRHSKQMMRLIEHREPEVGDFPMFKYQHIGVMVSKGNVVHASVFTKRVDESSMAEMPRCVGVVPFSGLVEAALYSGINTVL